MRMLVVSLVLEQAALDAEQADVLGSRIADDPRAATVDRIWVRAVDLFLAPEFRRDMYVSVVSSTALTW